MPHQSPEDLTNRDAAVRRGPARGLDKSATSELVPLFATCALPGCLAGCGEYLRPARPSEPPLTEQILAERDAAVADMYRRRELVAAAKTGDPDAARLARMETRLIAQIPTGDGDRKPMQTCWLREERHTCTKTAQGWECNSCQAVQ
jgi:hypothetical protein